MAVEWYVILLGGLPAAVAAYTFYTVLKNRLEEQKIREQGTPLIGVVVQANSDLFRPNLIDQPAQIVISFPEEAQATPQELEEIARRLYALKEGPLNTPFEQELAELVRNEQFRPGERTLLPTAFTYGKKVYSTGLWIRRKLLKGSYLTQGYVHCMALPGERGLVVMLPHPEEPIKDC